MKQWSAHEKSYMKYFTLFIFLLLLLFILIFEMIMKFQVRATLSKNMGFFLFFLFAGLIIFLPHHLAVKLVKIKENRERERERLNIISSGNWKFPIDEFYNTCVSRKATDVFNNSSVEKMMLIAKHIIENEKIPSEYVHLYYDKEKVKQYFNDAKHRDELEKNTPHKFKAYIHNEKSSKFALQIERQIV